MAEEAEKLAATAAASATQIVAKAEEVTDAIQRQTDEFVAASEKVAAQAAARVKVVGAALVKQSSDFDEVSIRATERGQEISTEFTRRSEDLIAVVDRVAERAGSISGIFIEQSDRLLESSQTATIPSKKIQDLLGV